MTNSRLASIFREPWLVQVAIFTYLDLLVFPYFQIIIMPFSLPLILISILLYNGKLTLPNGFKLPFLIISLCVLISNLIGFLIPSSVYFAFSNLKYGLQFLLSFLYFVFFYNINYKYHIEKYLFLISFIFLFLFISTGLIFITNPIDTSSIISDIYGRTTQVKSDLIFLRFAFLFSDPNTAGYFLLIALFPWLPFLKNKLLEIIITLLLLFSIILTQSKGALLAFFICLFFHFNPFKITLSSKVKKSLFIKFIFLFISLLTGCFLIYYLFIYNNQSLNLEQFIALDLFIERILSPLSEDAGRIDIWNNVIFRVMPLPIGRGHDFIIGLSSLFSPHSDILRLAYSYGYIVLFIFLGWLSNLFLKFPLLITPAFIAFSLNSLIDEQKLFGLFLSILGVLLSTSLNANENHIKHSS